MTHNSPLASPRATIDKLTQWGIVTQKSLGQHLLVDDGVVGRILRLADLTQDDTVLEVGPGIGTLTQALLLKGAHVLALEKDKRLLPLLEELQEEYPHLFRFEHIDALDYLRQGYKPHDSQDLLPQKLIANLPYAVAATLVLDFFQFMPSIRTATVMVQKEVGERMAAEPGSKDYGAYSVKLQLLAKPQDRFLVSRSCFLPPPRVDSMVIRLDRLGESVSPDESVSPESISPDELSAAFTVVEAAFAQRRKTIRNSLCSSFAQKGLDRSLADQLLESANIPPTVRAETLPPQTFLTLGRLLGHLTPNGTPRVNPPAPDIPRPGQTE